MTNQNISLGMEVTRLREL